MLQVSNKPIILNLTVVLSELFISSITLAPVVESNADTKLEKLISELIYRSANNTLIVQLGIKPKRDTNIG